MNWIILNSEDQFHELLKNSSERPQLIYKHSSRCNLSAVIKDSLENEDAPEGIDYYFLDIISTRPLSNKIAKELHVHHESPQVLVVKDGKCVFEESHFAIRMEDIIRAALGEQKVYENSDF
jgi:bacillithiol system protein YtxJ